MLRFHLSNWILSRRQYCKLKVSRYFPPSFLKDPASGSVYDEVLNLFLESCTMHVFCFSIVIFCWSFCTGLPSLERKKSWFNFISWCSYWGLFVFVWPRHHGLFVIEWLNYSFSRDNFSVFPCRLILFLAWVLHMTLEKMSVIIYTSPIQQCLKFSYTLVFLLDLYCERRNSFWSYNFSRSPFSVEVVLCHIIAYKESQLDSICLCRSCISTWMDGWYGSQSHYSY